MYQDFLLNLCSADSLSGLCSADSDHLSQWQKCSSVFVIHKDVLASESLEDDSVLRSALVADV